MRIEPMVLRAHLAIVAAAVIFGSTFVVMKDAVVDAAPVPLVAARFLIGAVVLLPWALRGQPQPGVIRTGVLCGAALCAGYLFQVVGLQYVSSSVSAFITYLLVVVVPLIGAVRTRRWPEPIVMLSVAIAVVGLVLLTGQGATLGKGELLTVGCAVFFAIHIVLLSERSSQFSTSRLNSVQFATVGLVCLIPGWMLGGYDFDARTWAAAAFLGVVASAVALGLQVWGQRIVRSTRTALLLLIEPVAAAAFGFAVGDRLGWPGVVGAFLILGAVALAEAPLTRRPSGRYDADLAH